jgi:hypothetical protein
MTQDNNRYILAWFLGSGFFILIVLLIFFDIKEGSKEIVYTLLGSFGTAFGIIFLGQVRVLKRRLRC